MKMDQKPAVGDRAAGHKKHFGAPTANPEQSGHKFKDFIPSKELTP